MLFLFFNLHLFSFPLSLVFCESSKWVDWWRYGFPYSCWPCLQSQDFSSYEYDHIHQYIHANLIIYVRYKVFFIIICLFFRQYKLEIKVCIVSFQWMIRASERLSSYRFCQIDFINIVEFHSKDFLCKKLGSFQFLQTSKMVQFLDK